MTLAITWYWLVGAIFAGYAVLDGFDLGVGVLHLRADANRERRELLEAIGPVWDGNEVWLVVAGGTLFAAFPPVYAAVFSGFYLALILLLLALIFRAVAIEFRSKRPEPWWRQTWDVAFWMASVLASVLLGLALGNVLHGVAFDAAGNFRSSVLDLLNPYPLLVAFTALALFVMHGAVYLVMRTTGPLQERAAGWARRSLYLFAALFALLSVVTVLFVPHLSERIRARPWLWCVPVLTASALAVVLYELRTDRRWRAFLGSAAAVVSVLLLAALTMYPVLVFGSHAGENLTALNSASTPRTLRVMLIIAGIGLPLALCYFAVVYRLFRGKVQLERRSY